MAESMQWRIVAHVRGSSGDVHTIKSRVGDGHLGCSCTAYKFAPKDAKTCKHILQFTSGNSIATAMAETSLAKFVDKTYGGSRGGGKTSDQRRTEEPRRAEPMQKPRRAVVVGSDGI